MSYKVLINSDANHFTIDSGMTVAELYEEEARNFHQFISDNTEYMDADLTIKAYSDSGIGTNYILFDNTTKLPIADITNYDTW